VRERVEESAYGFALVVSKGGILLGRLRRSLLQNCDPELRAEEVMESGPSTVRPDSELPSLVERLRKRGFAFAIVTGPDGKLIGVVRCRDAEAVSRPT
jgi:CBS domain-containing protein